jgi:hypothetical protein
VVVVCGALKNPLLLPFVVNVGIVVVGWLMEFEPNRLVDNAGCCVSSLNVVLGTADEVAAADPKLNVFDGAGVVAVDIPNDIDGAWSFDTAALLFPNKDDENRPAVTVGFDVTGSPVFFPKLNGVLLIVLVVVDDDEPNVRPLVGANVNLPLDSLLFPNESPPI